MSVLQTEACENCGRQIGRLETNYIFRSHVVCEACNGALSRGVTPRWEPPTVPYATPAPAVGGAGSEKRTSGLGIASLVLGICGLVTVCIPPLGVILSFLGLLLGIIGWSVADRNTSSKMPEAGIITSALPFIVGIVVLFYAMVRH